MGKYNSMSAASLRTEIASLERKHGMYKQQLFDVEHSDKNPAALRLVKMRLRQTKWRLRFAKSALRKKS